MNELYLCLCGKKKKWHVVKDGKTLCGENRMFKIDTSKCEKWNDNIRFVERYDCRNCFKKAGLILEQEKKENI